MFVLRPSTLVLAAFMSAVCGSAFAAPSYTDPFSTKQVYTTASSTGSYTVTDENGGVQSAWISGNDTLKYSRQPQTPNRPFTYQSSIILTNGSDASGGNTATYPRFTVTGTLTNVYTNNSAQAGIIVNGDAQNGGYLLEIDNGQGSQFALIAESGNELTSDEGSGEVVKTFGAPLSNQSYTVSVTEDRSGTNSSYPGENVFDVSILNSDGSTFYPTTTFADPLSPLGFGGTEIGYRVRDPNDSDTPSFGELSFSVPEPNSLALLGIALSLFRHRRAPRRVRRSE